MKIWTTVFLLLAIMPILTAQTGDYTEAEKADLVTIAEIYTNDVIFFDDAAIGKLLPFQDGKFGQLAKTMIAIVSPDESILQTEFMKKPSAEDLLNWSIVQGVYNNLSEEVTNLSILENVIENPPSDAVQLHNYYSSIKSKFSNLVNTNDLSKYNLEYATLGLETETEKAIFLMNIITASTQRFQVLQMLNKFETIQELIARLPKFDGQPYYLYKDFDYEDFNIVVDGEEVSYNEKNINLLYNTLMAHFTATARTVSKQAGYKFYRSSILSEPKYFEYSASHAILKQIYDSLEE